MAPSIAEHTVKQPVGDTRRKLLGKAGISAAATAFLAALGPVGAALVSGDARAQSAFSDQDILNFALNLEYLEGQYYTLGATGAGLPATLLTGTGAQGLVNGGSIVPWQNAYFFEIAAKISVDEQGHIGFIRSQLGSAAVAQPTLDLAGGFQAAALASGAIAPGQVFNPFADEISFFLGAFTLTEVGITAYTGAAALISNPVVLTAAAQILAIEAYHAGAIRTVLTQSSLGSGSTNVVNLPADAAKAALVPYQTQAVATAQNQLSTAFTAIGIVNPQDGLAQISARDGNALAFRRTPGQVLNIVQGGLPLKNAGNFFPNGLNGNIR